MEYRGISGLLCVDVCMYIWMDGWIDTHMTDRWQADRQTDRQMIDRQTDDR